MGSRLIAAVAALFLLLPSAGDAKVRTDASFSFPAGKPVRIIVFRPDVQVGTMTMGGVEEPNAEWTRTARDKLAARLRQNQAAGGNDVTFLADQEGDAATVVADYQALFRAVASAVVGYNLYGVKLPTKKDRFDWTLGPGAAKLGEIGSGNYALFLYTHDAYGTGGRKAMQIMAGLFGSVVPAGIHVSYAALVDLATGNLVWFNVDPGSGGDPRTDDGATKRIDQLLQTMPRRTAAAGHAR